VIISDIGMPRMNGYQLPKLCEPFRIRGGAMIAVTGFGHV